MSRKECASLGAEPPRCQRCSTPMLWIHSSWQCPGCKFKEGCCG